MFVSKPEDFHPIWAEAFNSGNKEAVLAFFEEDATMVAQPGQVVKGKGIISQVLDGFLALEAKMEVKPKVVVQNDEIAIMISDWRLKGSDPEGNPIDMTGQTTDVLRRQSDGRWLLVIDNPYGNQAA
jgi:uncharacterized protein (TIGR02246 family)